MYFRGLAERGAAKAMRSKAMASLPQHGLNPRAGAGGCRELGPAAAGLRHSRRARLAPVPALRCRHGSSRTGGAKLSGLAVFPAAATRRGKRPGGALSLWCSRTGAAPGVPGPNGRIVPASSAECLGTARTVPRLSSGQMLLIRQRKLFTLFTRVSSPRRLIFGVAREGLAEPGPGRAGAGPCRGRAGTGTDGAAASCEGSQRHLVAASEIAACAPRAGQRARFELSSPNPCFTREVSSQTLNAKTILTKVHVPLFLMKPISFFWVFYLFLPML